jgi:hypothetical protein
MRGREDIPAGGKKMITTQGEMIDEAIELAKAVKGLNISVAGDRDALEVAKAVRGLNIK